MGNQNEGDGSLVSLYEDKNRLATNQNEYRETGRQGDGDGGRFSCLPLLFFIIATLALINSSCLKKQGEGFRFKTLPNMNPVFKGLLLGFLFFMFLLVFWFSIHAINILTIVIGLYLCKMAYDWDPNVEAELQTRYFVNIIIRSTMVGLIFVLYVVVLQRFNLVYNYRLILSGLYYSTLILSVLLVNFQKRRGIV